MVCREHRWVALGRENRQGRFDEVMLLVGDQLPEGSIYGLLALTVGVGQTEIICGSSHVAPR